MKWQDGAVFEGNWQKGKAHGTGRLTQPDGHIIEGVWKNNLLVDENYLQKLLSAKSSHSHFSKLTKDKARLWSPSS